MGQEESKSQTLGVGDALIYKIQTTVDGGMRITIDLPETDIDLVQSLMRKKAQGSPRVLLCFMEPSDG